MAFDTELEHEEQLNAMRERTLESEREARSDHLRRRERERVSDLWRARLVIAAIVCAFFLAAMFYAHNYRYTTYSVDSEMVLASVATARTFPFQEGTVVVGTDSVSYVKNNSVVWDNAVKVQDPVYRSEGEYFCLFPRGGYTAYICNESGIFSTIKVSRPIRTADISQAGVVALATESEDSSYITYYDRFGTHVDVGVKTTLDVSGYPVHLSISPDGQKLLVLYYSVANGIGESRAVFYDFQNGSADRSYVIQAFEDFYESDTFLVRCEFTDNRHASVIGDNAFLFLTDTGKEVTRNTVPIADEVHSALFMGQELLVVTEKDGKAFLTTYDNTGRLLHSFECPKDYDLVASNGRYVAFLTGADLRFYNASGKLRYEGTLVSAPRSMSFMGTKSLFLNTGDVLEKITLK
ncbi:MAG: hypothetical protein IK150_08810 [Lachnospiraceae bacterium]|nr:hypothetical protein [Lachnospiraceae bacterium]